MEIANVRSKDKIQKDGATLVESSGNPLGVELVHAYRATKTATPNDIVELAQVVQRGDAGVHSVACNQLAVIADQIRALQEQAQQVLERAKRDGELHHAACNIVKKPGSTYYMYERESGQKYISILSPKDWGSNVPKTFHGGYRLEVDGSWTPIDEIRVKDEKMRMMDAVLTSKQGIVRAAIGPAYTVN